MSKKKPKFYFPPKKKPLTVSDDVKAELEKIAMEMADREIERRQDKNVENYIIYTLEALIRLGWTGKVRLSRFLDTLTEVSEEATTADTAAYVNEIKARLEAKGIFFDEERKNDDRPQLEGS